MDHTLRLMEQTGHRTAEKRSISGHAKRSSGNLALTLRSRQLWQAIAARLKVLVVDEVLGRSTIGNAIKGAQDKFNLKSILQNSTIIRG